MERAARSAYVLRHLPCGVSRPCPRGGCSARLPTSRVRQSLVVVPRTSTPTLTSSAGAEVREDEALKAAVAHTGGARGCFFSPSALPGGLRRCRNPRCPGQTLEALSPTSRSMARAFSSIPRLLHRPCSRRTSTSERGRAPSSADCAIAKDYEACSANRESSIRRARRRQPLGKRERHGVKPRPFSASNCAIRITQRDVPCQAPLPSCQKVRPLRSRSPSYG